ncbi:SDR family oxidoreductase [Siminovitchia sp. 179-K 8D1 HS]|uniref:SDR family oxidoreductase n=1 Tax=Siminovitchia sp. 179-K 8D1 HS TaxID=3142385 RepID=UPI0039A23FA7
MEFNDFDFVNKQIVISGGTGDLGKEISLELLKRGGALTVIGTNQNKFEKLKKTAQPFSDRIKWLQADLSNDNGIKKVCNHFSEKDKIDILINLAGINLRNPILNTTFEEWDKVLNANLKAPYFLSQYAAKKMLKEKKGKIIHIGSLSSVLGLPNMGPYGASKGAVVQITKSMAVEWAPYIQVNAVAPGYYETTLTESIFKDEKRKKEILSRIPTNRTGEPKDLVGAVLFLSSDLSNYITGQTLFVDGGWTAY